TARHRTGDRPRVAGGHRHAAAANDAGPIARVRAARDAGMKLSSSNLVEVDRRRVFAALVDPDVLCRLIPGCQTLALTSPDAYDATLKIGLAGLKGTYSGKATLTDKRPPDALTISFEGKGAPGFVRGSAAIALTDEGVATRVSYDADV